MNLNEAEILLWAAFPGADEVKAQYMDFGAKMGLAISFEGKRQGIHFDPAKDDIHSVIAQLKQRLVPS